jgi:hypothetical protein
MTRNNISSVYTVQTTVNALHDIPIDFKVTNENDSKAMGGMFVVVKPFNNNLQVLR